MRVIVNIHSPYLSKEERLQGARHNSQVFTAEELLANYPDTFSSGDAEVGEIYMNAIINRMKDSEILHSLLDNIEMSEVG